MAETQKDQKPTEAAPSGQNGGKENETMTSTTGAGSFPDKGRPTEVTSDVQEEDAGPASVNRYVERRDGVRVGQVVPKENEGFAKHLVDEAKAYFEGRVECPRCHVADGFVKGGTNCNSCGYSIAADPTTDKATV